MNGRAGPAAWALRFGLAFLALNTLLTFENRWPGLGVLYMPRLSFELCWIVVALMAWVRWRGGLSTRAASVAGGLFVLLVLVRYADVTAPGVLGRPVNLYWDARHTAELVRLAAQDRPFCHPPAFTATLLLALALLGWVARRALLTLAGCLAWRPPRPWLLAATAALTLSFSAYVPGQRDTRWFFSLPVAPTLMNQSLLLARALVPGHADAVLGESPRFEGGISALGEGPGAVDVLLIFAESYGASAVDDPAFREALAPSRTDLMGAFAGSGRAVVSARVRSPTFGGASWLAHAALLSGLDTSDPAHHALLLTSQRPTLVGHFARHGYRTVGWMPGLKRPWPEGVFYGFDRLAGDAGIGYGGPDFGFWRIPDQAAMALLHQQELADTAPTGARAPRFVVFPTITTHAPFHPIAPLVTDWARLTGANAYTAEEVRAALGAAPAPDQARAQYLASMRYQFGWLSAYVRERAARSTLLIIVGDHQPPALVTGPGASWDVPVHVASNDPVLLRRLMARGFQPGLLPPSTTLGPMHQLTQHLLAVFDAPDREALSEEERLADTGNAFPEATPQFPIPDS